MIKTKRILLTLLIALMCISIVFTAVACKDDNPTTSTEIEEVETLFTNGNFTGTSSAADAEYPHKPENWTGTPGSTSSSSSLKTPQSKDDLTVGIIDITKTDASLGGSPNKPNAETNKDNKVLMINNKKYTSYRYVSDNVTLSKDKYYKLSLFVKTTNIENKSEKGGAYVYVTGNAYAAFEEINTQNEWVEYTVYFRTAQTQDYTIQLSLGLGTGNLETGYMTKGSAYFDCIVLTDLTDVEEGQEAFTADKFNAIAINDKTAKCDMRSFDKTFSYASSVTTLPYTPAQFTGKAGSGSGTTASTGSSYVEKGILDIATAGDEYTFSALGSTPYALTKTSDSSIGSRMLYIHNKQKTAYGYKDNLGVAIEKNTYYEISAYVRTSIVEGTGAVVRLVTTSNDVLAQVNNINTSDAWQKITFFVEGHAYSNNSLNIEFWLGNGGSGDGNWTKGVAFFDDFSYEEITKDTYNAKTAEILGGTLLNAAQYSFAKEEGTLVNMTDTLFKSTQYTDSFITETGAPKYSTVSLETTDVFGAAQNVLVLNNTKPTALSVSTIYKTAFDADTTDETNKDLFKILPNTVYELTFWLKTVDVDAAKSATINIITYDPEKAADYSKATTSILTISSLNSESLTAFADEDRDGYTRFSAYILGAEKDTKYAGINITFGTGASASQSAGFVSGKLYLTNIRIQTVDYATYTSTATSTVIHKKSLGGSGASGELSSNGNFTYVDISSTNTTYKDTLDTVWVDNKLVGTAVPQNWTITDSTALTVNGGNSTAGVIDVNNYTLSNIEASLTADNIYANLPSEMTAKDYPNLLYINAVNVPSLGYSSQMINLSAKSYYMVSVFARAFEGTFSIDVTPSSLKNPDVTAMQYTATQVGSDWLNYVFFIKTGVTSTSVKVTLYAGYPGNTVASGSHKVLFTMAQYATITESVYNAAVAADEDNTSTDINLLVNRTKFQSWYTDTMDTTSTSYTEQLNTPSNWTGAVVDSSAPTGAEDLVKGVFDRTSSDWNQIDIDPDATDSFADTLYDETKNVGDSVLVIYNKEAGSYGYSCSSFILEAGKYYKISVDILTKDIAYLTQEQADKDKEKYENWTDKKSYATATVTLSLNNKNYSFGKTLEKEKTFADDETGAQEKADYEIDVQRIVTPNEWTTYTFYVALDSEIEGTVSTSLKVSLGGKNVSLWETGYVFMDNFALEEMKEIDFVGDEANGIDPIVPSAESLTKDNVLTKTTYRIDFTNDDATAEAEVEEEEEEPQQNEEAKNWLWLYITSGIIGGLIVIVLVVFIIKKYAPKQKKIKKSKKTTTIAKDSTKNKFGE